MSGRRSGPGLPDVGTAGSRRERASEWLLLDGRRENVSIALAALFFAFFSTLTVVGPVPLLDVQSLFYVYSGLIAGNITIVTVVVSINQLLLSRELQTPGELREQIDEVIEYRSEVEDATARSRPSNRSASCGSSSSRRVKRPSGSAA